MAVIKTAISLDIPRSRLLATAAENDRLLAQLNQAYASEPEPAEVQVQQALRARRRAKASAE